VTHQPHLLLLWLVALEANYRLFWPLEKPLSSQRISTSFDPKPIRSVCPVILRSLSFGIKVIAHSGTIGLPKRLLQWITGRQTGKVGTSYAGVKLLTQWYTINFSHPMYPEALKMHGPSFSRA
jgi:hypothetical protein